MHVCDAYPVLSPVSSTDSGSSQVGSLRFPVDTLLEEGTEYETRDVYQLEPCDAVPAGMRVEVGFFLRALFEPEESYPPGS